MCLAAVACHRNAAHMDDLLGPGVIFCQRVLKSQVAHRCKKKKKKLDPPVMEACTYRLHSYHAGMFLSVCVLTSPCVQT